ncbi:hypothetical protein GIB67_008706 [Kingdonia uniflora]|uniref:Uncharacterized protein n=1 Tax=Kingdonia uniflora TaxID=39325 RepID=A0A7J7NHA3_9MAGN|nr:hypothetical protein GIB67_008706 [Kingdonia uniflora]
MVTTRRQAYEVRVQTKIASLQTRYFGTQSLSLPNPIPVPLTLYGMSWEEVEEAEDDFHQLWRSHYVVLFAAHRRSCLRMLAEDAALAEGKKVGKSSEKYCRYPAKDWMRSKNPKPSSKFLVSACSEESSSSDRTMDDSVVIDTVTADNLSVSSGRDVGLHAGDKTGQFLKPNSKVVADTSSLFDIGVNLEATEQEALDLATRDPIRLDTQIRSRISQLPVAWKSAAEVLKLAVVNRGKLVRQHDTEKATLQE